MRTDAFRFKPPSGQLPAAAVDALLRAFAERSVGARRGAEPRQVLAWASRLGLGPRIAHRLPPEVLARELGDEAAAAALQRARTEAAARTLVLRRLLQRVAARAERLAVPLLALKGMALLESGSVVIGSRPIGDLDVLTSDEGSRRLTPALEALGLRPTGEPASRHHDAPMAHPQMGLLEIHRRLPALSGNGRRGPSAEDLLASGRCRSPSGPSRAWIPEPIVLVAHAAAHALDQHGACPRIYPLTRAVADLIDLADEEGRSPAGLLRDATPLLRRSVSARELRALAELCDGLAAGMPLALDGDAAALLRHVVAGMTDRDYRRHLRLAAGLAALRRGDWRRLRQRLSPLAVAGRNR